MCNRLLVGRRLERVRIIGRVTAYGIGYKERWPHERPPVRGNLSAVAFRLAPTRHRPQIYFFQIKNSRFRVTPDKGGGGRTLWISEFTKGNKTRQTLEDSVELQQLSIQLGGAPRLNYNRKKAFALLWSNLPQRRPPHRDPVMCASEFFSAPPEKWILIGSAFNANLHVLDSCWVFVVTHKHIRYRITAAQCCYHPNAIKSHCRLRITVIINLN